MPNKNEFDISIIGQTFHYLTVESLEPGNKRAIAICKCKCGNICKTRPTTLKRGEKTSCGCQNYLDIIGKQFDSN